MKKERTSQTQHILYMLNHAKVCIEKIVDYSDFLNNDTNITCNLSFE